MQISHYKGVNPSQAEYHGAEELVPVLDVGVGEEEAQEDDRHHEQDGYDGEVENLGTPGMREKIVHISKYKY